MYIFQVRNLFRISSYSPSIVISMDETVIWADMLSETMVEKIGSKSFSLKTSGHEKVSVI